MTTAAASYDEVPYPGKPYAQTHPDRLAVIARLFGWKTRDISACRVLDVGCGDATNLLTMAASLPGAEFIGIDLSASSIARGTSLAHKAGVKNVTLRAIDLLNLSSAVGDFDYIVAHGVYSWVPSPVRDGLLRMCGQRLRPDGVAMVSYATYPGGFIEQLMRAPMLSEAARNDGDKIGAARRFVDAVVEHAPSSAIRALYLEEWDKIKTNCDAFLLHDQLSEVYTPVYFTDFVRHAAAHGLQYLGEAELAGDAASEPNESRIDAGQRLDFLNCRRFRQTILCREGSPVLPRPDISALRGCYAAAPSYLEGGSSLPALANAWPGFVEADETLFGPFVAGKIEVRTVPPALDNGNTSRPRATALARAQAAEGESVANLLHHTVRIEDEFTRKLLTLLDGRRTRRELLAELSQRSATPEKVTAEIDRILKMLGDHALLRGE